LIIKELAVGPIMANCFIAGCEDTLEAVVIDPGDEADRILMALAEFKLTVRYIINTHGHFDHVGGNRQLKEATDADLLIHSQDAFMLEHLTTAAASFGMAVDNSPAADRLLEDGDTITFGKKTLTVIHTPGHTPGGISLLADNDVFVGDTLFAGSIGRTDFPGGDFNTLIAAIQNRLFALDDQVTVHCGHGPATTIGREKQTNPFVRM
jgi:glyoxylase-like metal-dependent hydrolase (beta-lactamase superfamily II)